MEIELILNNLLRKFETEKYFKRKDNQIFLNEFTDKLSIKAMENALNK
jgi:hypothetical protein